MASKNDQKYMNHPLKSNDQTSVWSRFLVASDKQTAKCKLCSKIIMTKGGSTKGLHKHTAMHTNKTNKDKNVKDTKRHEIEIISDEDDHEDGPSTSCKQRKINEFFMADNADNDNSLEAVIARMAAVDGFPFRVFITSIDLRKGLEARGFVNLPLSPSTIKTKVISYCKKVFESFGQNFEKSRQNGRCFSITFDEWTSNRNKRYININVHGFFENSSEIKFWNLGLVPIPGSMPAETCIDLVQNKLKDFNLSLENDIVGLTTDGASVMVKVGQLVAAHQQLCFAHGIQLGVIDVLYSSKVNNKEEESNDNDEEDDDDENDEMGRLEIVGDALEEYDLTADYNISFLVKEVRRIVRIFRKSPLKNVTLQKYVREKHTKDLQLILDCKTRWNSLVEMLSRFLLLKDCIMKTLIDLAIPNTLNDSDFERLIDIVDSLEPVKLTVLALCRHDANLYTADIAFNFMFEELKRMSSPLSIRLFESLKNRINQRRTIASEAMSYLTNPKDHLAISIFSSADPKSVSAFIRKVVKRLSSSTEMEDSDDEIPLAQFRQNAQNEVHFTSLKEKLDAALKNAKNTSTTCAAIPKGQDGLKKIIEKEMALFENGGNRGRFLQLAYDYLSTIPPTSVESERAFSVAGSFATKIRSSLGNESLTALVALKSYFNQKT